MSAPCDRAFPECRGHSGKFDNCLAESLYEQCAGMIGWADEEGGSTEYQGYMWLILGVDSIEITADEWSGGFDIRTVPGTWLTLLTTDQGFVYLTGYNSRDDAQAAYDEHIRAWEIWDAANDAADHAQAYGYVTSGRGL